MEPDTGRSSHTTGGTTEVGGDLGAPQRPGEHGAGRLAGARHKSPGLRRTSP